MDSVFFLTYAYWVTKFSLKNVSSCHLGITKGSLGVHSVPFSRAVWSTLWSMELVQPAELKAHTASSDKRREGGPSDSTCRHLFPPHHCKAIAPPSPARKPSAQILTNAVNAIASLDFHSNSPKMEYYTVCLLTRKVEL